MQRRCFGKMQELALWGIEGLELRTARRWNKRVSNYDGSETSESIRGREKLGKLWRLTKLKSAIKGRNILEEV